MRKQYGITMIELVIVVIIILIIATFSIYSGSNALEQATVTEVYVEMNAMKKAINDLNIERSFSDDFELIQGVHYDTKVADTWDNVTEFETVYGSNIPNADFDNLYIIYGMDGIGKAQGYELNKGVREHFGFDSIKHSYLVNFENGDVQLLESMKLSNQKVRTYSQVRALVDEGEI